MNEGEQTVCIQEDDPSACDEMISANSYIATDKNANACMYCANYAQNAERAWSVMSSFVQQLSQIQSLENENQQLSRINEEQQVYMANQRLRYQSADEELLKSGAKIRELEDRLQCVNTQYREVLNKATEAQEAANTWRRKYDMSQELIVELERKTAENHKLHISSLAVAASFSKSHEAIEARNTSLVAKVADLEHQNKDLHRKVNDLECRTRLMETQLNRPRLDRACSPIHALLVPSALIEMPSASVPVDAPPSPRVELERNAALSPRTSLKAAAPKSLSANEWSKHRRRDFTEISIEMPPPPSPAPRVRSQKRSVAEVAPPPPSADERPKRRRRNSAAIAEIFQCIFFMEFSAQTLVDPHKIDFDAFKTPSIPLMEGVQSDAVEHLKTAGVGDVISSKAFAEPIDGIEERVDAMAKATGSGDARQADAAAPVHAIASKSPPFNCVTPDRVSVDSRKILSIGFEMEDEDEDRPLEIVEDCGSSVG